MSKIPQITFLNMTPDTIVAGSIFDTVFVSFSFADGDADIGNDPNTTLTNNDIFIKDSHDTSGFVGGYLPPIDHNIEDATKGLTGTIIIKQPCGLIYPRNDSLHKATGDTLHYEIYIVDRAGHISDTIVTPNLYIRP